MAATQDPPLYDEAASLAELARNRLRRDEATRLQVQLADRLAGQLLRHFAAGEAETAGRGLLLGAASAIDLVNEGIHASVIVNVLGFAAARLVTDGRAWTGAQQEAGRGDHH